MLCPLLLEHLVVLAVQGEWAPTFPASCVATPCCEMHVMFSVDEHVANVLSFLTCRLLSISVPALPSPTLSRKVSAARTTHTRGNEHTTVPVLNRSKLQVDLMAHEAALFTNPALKSTAEQLFAKVLTQCNICCEVKAAQSVVVNGIKLQVTLVVQIPVPVS